MRTIEDAFDTITNKSDLPISIVLHENDFEEKFLTQKLFLYYEFARGFNCAILDMAELNSPVLDQVEDPVSWWAAQIAKSLGLAVDGGFCVNSLVRYPALQKQRSLVFVRGLSNLESNACIASAILRDAPNIMRDYSLSNLANVGLIVFSKRSFLRRVLRQNVGQFESLHADTWIA